MSTRRRRRLVAVGVVAACGWLASACAGEGGGSSDQTAASTLPVVAGPVIRVQPPESAAQALTVAEVYGRYLRARGYRVEVLSPAPSGATALDGLERGEVDVVVDSIARVAAARAPDARVTAEPDQVVTVLRPALVNIGATVLDYSPAAAGDAFVVRSDSPAIKISNVRNLDYVLGAPADCERRLRCYVGLTDPDVYGIEFKDFTRLDPGPAMGDAVGGQGGGRGGVDRDCAPNRGAGLQDPGGRQALVPGPEPGAHPVLVGAEPPMGLGWWTTSTG